MRATRAYIASFGTTGLLLASALLTLSVMSALVAFNGFPGQDVQSPITPILVHERQAPVTIPTDPARADIGTTGSKRSGGSSGGDTTRRHASSDSPVAHSDPQRRRVSTQSPSTSAPSGSQQSGSTTSPVNTLTTTQPSPPSTSLPSTPSTPQVSTPSVPSVDPKLPVDTGTLNSGSLNTGSLNTGSLNTGTVDTGTVTQILP